MKIRQNIDIQNYTDGDSFITGRLYLENYK